MKILVAGDFCPRGRVAAAFEKEKYESVLNEVRSIITEADYSIVNFECPVVTSNAQPIMKYGPNLCCTSNGVKAIKYAGFDCVTLANNHFLDYGGEGVRETLYVLESHGVEHVGGGLNLADAAQILYKDIIGQRLAIVNCCEHEFSIATDTSAGSNPLNPIQQYNAIKEAHNNSDFVLVIVHGGHEHWQLPSPRMVETYRFFVDAGADAVVNHHQHCYSGYEIYCGKPIFYGLGNFCFDHPKERNSIWNEGYVVVLNFGDGDGIRYEIQPYRQCDMIPKVEPLAKNAFNDKLEDLNRIISDKGSLVNMTKRYYESCSKQYSNIFEPIGNHYYSVCKQRGWLPSFISNSRKLKAKDYICCEAHRDKLMYWLNNEIN